MATNQPDTKSTHSPNSNPSTKQHAVVSYQQNIVTSPVYSEKFVRDNVIAPFSQLSVVIVTAKNAHQPHHNNLDCVCYCAVPRRYIYLYRGRDHGPFYLRTTCHDRVVDLGHNLADACRTEQTSLLIILK